MKPDRFLGLDLSTQSLTAVVIEPDSGEIQQTAVNFDRDYPRYGTRRGVLPAVDPLRAHADPLMWLEALDDLLGILRERGWTRGVAAVGVSAQQHGTVYLNSGTEARLRGLAPTEALKSGLAGIFSRKTCPIWMDASTTRQCREITESLGGDMKIARLTGSVATERFAGPQVRKFWQENPQDYADTAHIAFISSFATSLLAGRLAPVDAGDGYGANLAGIRSGAWSPTAIEASAPGLGRRLPRLVARDEMIGPVSKYMVARYGFRPDTAVVVGSGDNPSSLVGLGLIGVEETRAVSLGTSDTYFGYMPRLQDVDHTEGHVFGAADGGAMFLVCFKNGSLAREEVRAAHGLGWEGFSEILLETPPGNRGRIMLPYFQPEITPRVMAAGVKRFGGLAPEDVSGNVRAVAEAQAISMYLHSGWAGPRPRTLLVTAGGSENRGLLTVIAQVFGAEVRTLDVRESAALGAALRAAHAWFARSTRPRTWRELFESMVKSVASRAALPSPGASRVYHGPHGLLAAYAACERYGLGEGPSPEEHIKAFRTVFPSA